MVKKVKKPVETVGNIDIAIEERTENIQEQPVKNKEEIKLPVEEKKQPEKKVIKPVLTPIQKFNADLQKTAESLQLAINDFGANQRYGSIDRLILSQKQLKEIIERTKGLC